MRFYITTPIYYVSDVPHIGHAYTTIVCDALARYHRLRGHKTRFLTGTDEHGQKIARMAEAAKVTPRQYADKFADAYRATWKALEISNDDFIRTTDADHEATVQELWRAMEKNGSIYEGEYEGWYCVACERFYTEKELLPGNVCPDHKTKVELVKEKSFYFKLSQYTQPLLEHYEKHPEFIQPANRRNEVMAFVREGLRDLSISRTTFAWGVPVPDRPGHIIYVWLDALCNYYSATRRSDDAKQFWDDPSSQVVHMIGKEISRFHAVYWPAFLMAAGWRLPTTVFAHGWWTVDGDKMSKTLGNVVDPLKLANDVGVDAFRYHVLREIPLGADGDFNHEQFIGRYNAELANDLGNLLNRTLGMVHKYGITPASAATEPFAVAAAMAWYASALDEFQPSKALEAVWNLVRAANTYIDQKAPWKPESPRAEILGNVLELCRVISHLLEPFMPERSVAMRAQVGLGDEPTAWPAWQPRSFSPAPATPLFPRIDDDRKKELLERWRPKKVTAAPVDEKADGRISFDDFGKVDLRVAKIVSAEPVPKAKKLLKLVVDLGEEQRQVVAGIAEAYAPETLVGKKVIFVANLKPATIRGVESQGMILAAGGEEILGLSAIDKDVPPGTKVR
ncbi:MAG TPA: methionine--tRNA ligase [Polyangia bacterium]